ncbi:glycosyltransferase family 2 protein [Microbulbifer thermotolerans]|uniref:glycosyltransferase family 2 protein n=1 Tax=Microbulbifer thermotolerans TaxID=252514 RepID=UPI00224B9CEB|nr:glycosyltransferase family 2 protein [Microbulbifer thermotolerans]MCX2780732.1 glycosyltransferase family 2 protein [Microbulbifer thermotolerans]MCX2806469.1 glycosyltransferase family 2 protein [Microbulbifer thermotolerans]MCX2841580.1 glycosyltransferase family 2 protein [Microbulbifer thermotolerans]
MLDSESVLEQKGVHYKDHDTRSVEFTILMPCLNEEKTLGECIQNAYAGLQKLNICGEVVVADNGSTDASKDIALKHGARIVHVSERGYGCALRAGIKAARGKFVIMGDADCSYDFCNLEGFISELRNGSELVCGNRFIGGIEPGAMPFLHQYVGNPVLSYLGKLFHGSSLGDFHCGLRGFSRDRILELGLKCSGMEFASEMIVRAARAGLRISEVPTKLYPDKRDRKPHLNTWRDGWRHLRFLLLLCPKWLFFIPGAVLFIVGLLVSFALFAFGKLHFGAISLGIHTEAFSLCAAFVGSMFLMLSLGARKIGEKLDIFRLNKLERFVIQSFTVERGLVIGGGVIGVGLWLAWISLMAWAEVGFSQVDPKSLMKSVLPSVFLVLFGVQFVVGALFNGLLDLYFSYNKRDN